VPEVVQLDTVPFRPEWDSRPRGLTLRPLMFQGRRVGASWQMIGTDSIAGGWGNGFVYLGFRAEVRGDSIVGTAKAESDAHVEGVPDPTAVIKGVRTACPREFAPKDH
jgi:hypothetical protein